MYVFFLVPETKGRTLEEMDEIFGSTGFAAEDAETKLRIDHEIGLFALLGDEPPLDIPETTEEAPKEVPADVPTEVPAEAEQPKQDAIVKEK